MFALNKLMVCTVLSCREDICSGKTREGWSSRWKRVIGELTGEEREPAEDRQGSWGRRTNEKKT